MRLRLELDGDTTGRLIEQAVVEQRSAARQAAVLLRQALGLPFPHSEQGGPLAEEKLDGSPNSARLEGKK